MFVKMYVPAYLFYKISCRIIAKHVSYLTGRIYESFQASHKIFRVTFLILGFVQKFTWIIHKKVYLCIALNVYWLAYTLNTFVIWKTNLQHSYKRTLYILCKFSLFSNIMRTDARYLNIFICGQILIYNLTVYYA